MLILNLTWALNKYMVEPTMANECWVNLSICRTCLSLSQFALDPSVGSRACVRLALRRAALTPSEAEARGPRRLAAGAAAGAG